jgi:hypothetical protein
MNPLTRHLREQHVGYWEHLGFAMGIAIRLLVCVTAFAIHALMPFISIEPKNDLEATAGFLQERNNWIETASERASSERNDSRAGANPVAA